METRFDFRGGRERSIDGQDGPLANSNKRGDKGFVTTFEVERTISFVGKFKLDWIFVKPLSLTEPYAKDQSHRFAPHFRTHPEDAQRSYQGAYLRPRADNGRLTDRRAGIGWWPRFTTVTSPVIPSAWCDSVALQRPLAARLYRSRLY